MVTVIGVPAARYAATTDALGRYRFDAPWRLGASPVLLNQLSH